MMPTQRHVCAPRVLSNIKYPEDKCCHSGDGMLSALLSPLTVDSIGTAVVSASETKVPKRSPVDEKSVGPGGEIGCEIDDVPGVRMPDLLFEMLFDVRFLPYSDLSHGVGYSESRCNGHFAPLTPQKTPEDEVASSGDDTRCKLSLGYISSYSGRDGADNRMDGLLEQAEGGNDIVSENLLGDAASEKTVLPASSLASYSWSSPPSSPEVGISRGESKKKNKKKNKKPKPILPRGMSKCRLLIRKQPTADRSVTTKSTRLSELNDIDDGDDEMDKRQSFLFLRRKKKKKKNNKGKKGWSGSVHIHEKGGRTDTTGDGSELACPPSVINREGEGDGDGHSAASELSASGRPMSDGHLFVGTKQNPNLSVSSPRAALPIHAAAGPTVPAFPPYSMRICDLSVDLCDIDSSRGKCGSIGSRWCNITSNFPTTASFILDEMVRLGVEYAKQDGNGTEGRNEDSSVGWIPTPETGKFLRRHDKLSASQKDESLEKLRSRMARDMVERSQVLVWSGTSSGRREKKLGRKTTGPHYCHHIPMAKARGIIRGATPQDLADLLLDSSRVREYNKLSTGRTDVLQLFRHGGGGASESTTSHIEMKIVRNTSKVPVINMSIEWLNMLHAREISLGDEFGGQNAFIVVSRAVLEGPPPMDHEEGKNFSRGPWNQRMKKERNEILLGVNLMRLVNGVEGDTDGCAETTRAMMTEFTSVTHVYSPLIPPFLAKRMGLKSAAAFVQDVQSYFERNIDETKVILQKSN